MINVDSIYDQILVEASTDTLYMTNTATKEFITVPAQVRSQFPLSNEPKILQIGQEMAELWPKTSKNGVMSQLY